MLVPILLNDKAAFYFAIFIKEEKNHGKDELE